MCVSVLHVIGGGNRNSHDCPYCGKTLVKLPQHLKTVHNVTDNVELTRLTQEAKVVSSEHLCLCRKCIYNCIYFTETLGESWWQ